MNLYSSFNDYWLKMLGSLVRVGNDVEVRGNKTKELLGDTVCFPMSKPFLTVPGRRISYDFMFAEAWWILSGQNRVDKLLEFAPSYKKFSDDGIRLTGAYGPKIIDQICYAVDCLINDPYSRQSVINIWRERPGPSKDIPCTLSVQFMIRDERIQTFVTMRSNDLWLGAPYDVVTMTMLTIQVAIELYVRTGKLYEIGYMHHTAASRHIYFKDLEKAKSVISSEQYIPTLDPEASINLKSLCTSLGDSLNFQSVLYSRINKANNELLYDTGFSTLHPWILYGLTNAC